MESRTNYLLIGSATLITVAAATIFGLWLANVIFQADRNTYLIYFTQPVTGLSTDSLVRLNGISVGLVKDIRLDPDHPKRAVVTIGIDSDVTIHADAVASVDQQGFTGQPFVGIVGGSAGAPALEPDEDRPSVIQSKATGMALLMQSAPEILDQVRAVTRRAAEMLGENQRTDVQQTLAAIRDVTRQIARHDQAIGQTIEDAAATAEELRSAADRLNAVLDHAQQVVGKGEDAVASISQASAEMQRMIAENRRPIHQMTTQGFLETRQLISDAQALVDKLTEVADQLEQNPSQILFGNERGGFRPETGR
ncbi:MAG: MlaD family protein [Geminicoccaceae bacterium]